MDLLKVSEVAELKGCSDRYIRKTIAAGKLSVVELPCNCNGQKEYGINIKDLPEPLQRKYYARKRTELGLQPAPKQTVKTVHKKRLNAVKKPLDEYTEDERRQIQRWTDIIREWLSYRDRSTSKKDVDKLYVAMCRLKNPDLQISEDILYRKFNAYRSNNIDGLVDRRGAWNKGATEIPQHILDGFYYYYLTESRPPLSRAYQLTIDWAREFYPADVPLIPGERSFRRQAAKLPDAIIKLMRFGEKALSDSYIPTVERWYEDLRANDVWIADNHTFDFHTIGDAGQVHRLYLTAFIDAKSGVMVGWNLTEQPDSHSTLLALRHGIMRFGVPKSIYVDNGSEFLTHDIGGRGHRTKKSWLASEMPPTILQMMDIKMHNALVRNAKAKPIERTFGTFKNHVSKMVTTYCGGTILERPETWKYKIKHGIIPEDQQIRDAFEVLVDGDYNVADYGGKERCYKGMSRIDVWNESIQETEFRKAPESELALLLARTTRYQKVNKNGVKIEFASKPLRYYCNEPGRETWRLIGKEVYVRYDPANLQTVRLYDKATDAYIDTWSLDSDMQIPYITGDKDEIAAAERNIRRASKSVHEYAKGLINIDPDKAIDSLQMSIIRAERGMNEFEIKQPKKFKPIMSDKTVLDNPDLANIESVEFTIDLEKLNRNAERRKEINNKGRF